MKACAISRHWPAELEIDVDAMLERALRTDATTGIRRAVFDLERLRSRRDLGRDTAAKISAAITLLKDAERMQTSRNH